MAERIGFIGLGNMGEPMARNIAAKGFELTIYDTDADRTKRIAQDIGAKAAASPEALGKAADIVVTMLPTGAIVRQVVLEQGLADGLATGSLIIDMTSSVPTISIELGKALAEKEIGLIDAPVSLSLIHI